MEGRAVAVESEPDRRRAASRVQVKCGSEPVKGSQKSRQPGAFYCYTGRRIAVRRGESNVAIVFQVVDCGHIARNCASCHSPGPSPFVLVIKHSSSAKVTRRSVIDVTSRR